MRLLERHKVWLLIAAGVIVAVIGAWLTNSQESHRGLLDPDNPAPSGAQALASVLEDQGVNLRVVRSASALDDADLGADVTIVVTSTSLLGDVGAEVLLHRTKGANVVVVEPDRHAVSALGLRLPDLGVSPAGAVTARCDEPLFDGLRLVAGHWRTYDRTSGCFEVESGVVVAQPSDTLTFFGAGQSLSNEQILRADNAAIALRLLGQTPDLVWYVPSATDLTSTDAVGLADLIPRWVQPGLWILGAGVVALLLWRVRRLGPLAVEPLPVTVKAIETTLSRGRLYRRTSDRAHAALGLKRAARDRIAERLPALMAISGRVVLLVLLGLVPVVLRPAFSTMWLWLLTVIVVVLLDLLMAPAPRLLELSRSPVGSVRQGYPTTSTMLVTNPSSRRVTALVRDSWQPSAGATANRFSLRLPPGDRILVRTPLQPTRRGDLTARGVTIRCRGPLGLASRQKTFDEPGTVRSLPPFESRKHLPSRLARLRELDGRSAVRVRGQGTEFDSLREYVRGDDVRSIDWRASARNRNVVVRTWQPERDRRVVMVLDTSRTSAGRVDDVPRLDSAMDAALLLGALAARAGDRIDFVAGDRRVRSRLRSAGSRDVATKLQDTMSPLEPVLAEADWAGLASAVAELGRHRALVVLLTPLEPSAIEEGLLPVLPTLTRHHRVVIASVQDPALTRLAASVESVDEVYLAAAAAQVIERRRRTIDLLGALGVEVIDRSASELPPALADHYLALKARGLL